MNIGQIYDTIKEKNEETGNQNAWVDVESNEIWVISEGDDTLIRFFAENCTLKDMTEEEVAEAVQMALSAISEEEPQPRWLWFPVR